RRPARGFARHYGSDVREVAFSAGGPTLVRLMDGREGRGSCLGCGKAPCMEKDPSELVLAGELDSYPGDPNLDVCPTRAVVWNRDGTAVAITDNCIGCGLCVARCPYGAIHLAGGEIARVETADPDRLVTRGRTEGAHPEPTRTGALAALDAPAATELPAAVSTLQDARAALLVRNLLHEVGVNARVRRRGDTNMRIDAVGQSRNGRPFVAEIELTPAVLESPRALLEDVAVLHSRYGFSVTDIDPLSVVLVLPNVRSEYYRVIRDIERVLNVRCRTITLGALVALLWTGTRLDGFQNAAFAVGDSGVDLEAGLGIPRALLREPYAGAFRPAG
ncbi:MAG: 4Fe-4S binding protein, partial [Armatimonadetes bacterium]|nr:4Fe-4S binding protein [Armatimonadota bacterium]